MNGRKQRGTEEYFQFKEVILIDHLWEVIPRTGLKK